MPVSVINPVSKSEVADDGDLELPGGMIEVRGIGHGDGIVANGGNCVAKVSPGS